MAVDVQVETTIERPRLDVAAHAGDPSNAPDWYDNIASVVWRTQPPVAVGSELDFVARFLGRRLIYTYRVSELVPGERLAMETAQGPFPMKTIYEWSDSGDGTRMTLRNTGRPSGFGKVAAPVMSAAMRRATTKDLANLKHILEP